MEIQKKHESLFLKEAKDLKNSEEAASFESLKKKQKTGGWVEWRRNVGNYELCGFAVSTHTNSST